MVCQTNRAMRLRRVFTCAELKDDRIFDYDYEHGHEHEHEHEGHSAFVEYDRA